MSQSHIRRRNFVFGALAASVVACRPRDEESEALGPFIAPAALAGRMDEVAAGKIAVFYVGPEALFSSRVPGARKLRDAGSTEGRRALTDAIAALPKDTEVVVYCGCCPVRSCPNVRPASAVVRASGRPNAYVLDLPTRFATDWADKGYPVERG